MKTYKLILIQLGLILLVYLMGAFISLKFNPLEWEEFSRAMYCLITLSILGFTTLFKYLSKQTYDIKSNNTFTRSK